MPDLKDIDFSGYATKNDIVCTDGRTIRRDAFKENDGKKVPLVWQHLRNDTSNVLGHAWLENRPDGVYAYAKFNGTKSGQEAKTLVMHGDLTSLSIYANQLTEQNKNVMHGSILELSLVYAGANAGAKIDYLAFAHSDGSESVSDEEALIYSDSPLEFPVAEVPAPVETPEVVHADAAAPADEETISGIFDTMNDKQKNVTYAIVEQAVDSALAEVASATHSADEGEIVMTNAFESQDPTLKVASKQVTLTHAQFGELLADAQQTGSLKKSIASHAVEYGIENIDYLFPDARNVTNAPVFIQRKMEWVGKVIAGTYHSPFSRIKSMTADITLDTARAKGYIKGNVKKDEFFALSRRTTTPTTIYKKQKLDRDDIIDITDLDVVAWMKTEMRVMLDEEIARAILLGDGREADDDDKINETNIRPIWKDEDLFAYHVQITDQDALPAALVKEVIRARKNYTGSGSPTMFTTTDFLTDLLLIEDNTGRPIYDTQASLEAKLRVSSIVEVPVMDGATRDTGTGPTLKHWKLLAIIVNLKDYTVGADKGGAVAMFDDFDLDVNQFKYLIETRISGALVLPHSALVIEIETAAG